MKTRKAQLKNKIRKSYFYVEGWKEPKIIPPKTKKGRTMIAVPQMDYGVDEDIAELFAKKRLKKKLTGGSTTSSTDWAVKGSKVMNVSKDFVKKFLKNPPKKERKLVDDIMDYESGQMSETNMKKMFQKLVNTGQAWKLQGHYGRTASAMLERGMINAPKVRNKLRKKRK